MLKMAPQQIIIGGSLSLCVNKPHFEIQNLNGVFDVVRIIWWSLVKRKRVSFPTGIVLYNVDDDTGLLVRFDVSCRSSPLLLSVISLMWPSTHIIVTCLWATTDTTRSLHSTPNEEVNLFSLKSLDHWLTIDANLKHSIHLYWSKYLLYWRNR